MSFSLPKNHQYYVKTVIKKIKNYILLGIWDNTDLSSLNSWLKNFKTDKEQYFAALLLDKIVYKNELSIQSSLNKMFHITLPNLLEQHNVYNQTDLQEWENDLKNPNEDQSLPFKFSTITSEKELGDSGSDYMRRLRKYYLVNRKLLIRIDSNKPSHVTTLIIIDDIIATGEQVKTFIEENSKHINQYKYVIFMPLLAHIKGLNAVKEKVLKLVHTEQLHTHNILIEPVETIYENSSFFYSPRTDQKIDAENTIEDLKLMYQNMMRKNLPQWTEDILFGYGELGMLLLLTTGIPDNTLPIIHSSNNDTDWIALYEKF
jgi:hypothetical protein